MVAAGGNGGTINQPKRKLDAMIGIQHVKDAANEKPSRGHKKGVPRRAATRTRAPPHACP